MLPSFNNIDIAALVVAAGKLFITAADAMPPPPDNAGYWQRWIHDFMQKLAENSSKVGASRTSPVTVTAVPVGGVKPLEKQPGEEPPK